MALSNVQTQHSAEKTIILGDFNVNWMSEDQRRSLYSFMIEENGYQQLVSSSTTNYKTLIDHVYTNVPNGLTEVNCGVFQTYFTGHNIIWASFHLKDKLKTAMINSTCVQVLLSTPRKILQTFFFICPLFNLDLPFPNLVYSNYSFLTMYIYFFNFRILTNCQKDKFSYNIANECSHASQY